MKKEEEQTEPQGGNIPISGSESEAPASRKYSRISHHSNVGSISEQHQEQYFPTETNLLTYALSPEYHVDLYGDNGAKISPESEELSQIGTKPEGAGQYMEECSVRYESPSEKPSKFRAPDQYEARIKALEEELGQDAKVKQLIMEQLQDLKRKYQEMQKGPSFLMERRKSVPQLPLEEMKRQSMERIPLLGHSITEYFGPREAEEDAKKSERSKIIKERANKMKRLTNKMLRIALERLIRKTQDDAQKNRERFQELEAENQKMKAVIASLRGKTDSAWSFDSTPQKNPPAEGYETPTLGQRRDVPPTQVPPLNLSSVRPLHISPHQQAVKSAFVVTPQKVEQRSKSAISTRSDKKRSVVPQYSIFYKTQKKPRMEWEEEKIRSRHKRKQAIDFEADKAQQLIEELSLRARRLDRMSREIRTIKRKYMSPTAVLILIVACVLVSIGLLIVIIKPI